MAAYGVVTAAFVVAIYLHRRTHLQPCGLGLDRPTCAVRSSWQDPVAILITVTGIIAAMALVTLDRRRRFANPS
jgi:hypothetical protein